MAHCDGEIAMENSERKKPQADGLKSLAELLFAFAVIMFLLGLMSSASFFALVAAVVFALPAIFVCRGLIRILAVIIVILGLLVAINSYDGSAKRQSSYVDSMKVRSAYDYGARVGDAVRNYRATTKAWPASTQDLKLEATYPVRSFTIGKDGVIRLVIDVPPPDDWSLVFTPVLEDAAVVNWRCSGQGIPQQVLPSECSEPDQPEKSS